MPRLKFRKPCNDCPFRRRSLRGWLGSSSPEQFSATVQSEMPMPCHETIDYSDPGWQITQLDDAALCAGALIHMRNQFKSPRDPKLSAAVNAVEPQKNVFQWPHEFIEHHNSGEFKSWE
jgi:hypothetical protein